MYDNNHPYYYIWRSFDAFGNVEENFFIMASTIHACQHLIIFGCKFLSTYQENNVYFLLEERTSRKTNDFVKLHVFARIFERLQ